MTKGLNASARSIWVVSWRPGLHGRRAHTAAQVELRRRIWQPALEATHGGTAAILSVGSINADCQMRVDALLRGAGTIVGRDLLVASGGKAGNVGVLARRLGAGARLFGCVGDDSFAELALAGPRDAGVDLSGVRRTRGHTGIAGIAVGPDGQKTILFSPGANGAWAGSAEDLATEIAGAPGGSVVVADLEVPIGVVRAALASARRARFPTILDPSPPQRLSGDLLSLVDHVTPDHREAERLTGVRTGSLDGAAQAASLLCERGAGAAYVKLASGGCVAAMDGNCTIIPVPEGVPVLDTTGAGDAFAGALAWALLEGRDALGAATVAVAASLCAVGRYGSQASYPSRPELEAMIARLPPPAAL